MKDRNQGNGKTRRRRKAPPPLPVFEAGNKVRIGGGHPEAGKYGEVERVVKLFGRPAVEIKFNEKGDGAVVFLDRCQVIPQ